MKNKKLWGGRFQENASEILERFNASLPFDKKLYKQDILGSKTHAKMLSHCGILTQEESQKICEGLEQIQEEIENEKFIFDISDEDIHMAIENRLIEIIGEVGKKLHTARSRNDQVALDFRLFVLNSNQKIRSLLLTLIQTLLEIAKLHTKTILPGMTHLQHAQPVNFGFLMCAYICMFMRDFERLESSFKRNNYCPLGSAALAGTPYQTDRFYTSKALGFTAPTLNATDSVSDRDFALDFLYDSSLIAMHISRMAEELGTKKEVCRVNEGSAAGLKSGLVNFGFNKFARSTKSFYTTDACTGCGLCAKNCPTHTITMENNRPVWGSKCYQCLKCINRCPAAAIQYGKATETRGRYTIEKYLGRI